MSWIQPHMTILFQGDSVTDNCRDYGNPNDLGPGYAKFVAELLNQKYPDYQLRFLNRGSAVTGRIIFWPAGRRTVSVCVRIFSLS